MVEVKTAAGGGKVDVKEIITLVIFLFVVIGFILLILKYAFGELYEQVKKLNPFANFTNPLLDPKYDMNKDQLQEAIKTHAARLSAGATTPIIENRVTYERSILPNLGLSANITNAITNMATGETFVRSQRDINYDASSPEPRTVVDDYNEQVSEYTSPTGTVLPEGITSREIFKEGFYWQ